MFKTLVIYIAFVLLLTGCAAIKELLFSPGPDDEPSVVDYVKTEFQKSSENSNDWTGTVVGGALALLGGVGLFGKKLVRKLRSRQEAKKSDFEGLIAGAAAGAVEKALEKLNDENVRGDLGESPKD